MSTVALQSELRRQDNHPDRPQYATLHCLQSGKPSGKMYLSQKDINVDAVENAVSVELA